MYTLHSDIHTPSDLLNQIQIQALKAQNNTRNARSRNPEALKTEIRELLKQKNAVIVAHYYVAAEIQELAEETGGHVSDSLDMAYFGRDHSATTLVVCGVRFMGETAAILTPDKRVLMPDLSADCSLDLGCPPDSFADFRKKHPDREVVVYTNTSAEIKAQADWVVTSGNAVNIIKHLHNQGKKILWAPDRHLGHWVQQQTNADILSWQGHCVVHDEFKEQSLAKLTKEMPDAVVIAHPESPPSVLKQAAVIGSTKVLINTTAQMDAKTFIVATDEGIFHKMQTAHPDKTFILAPTGGKGATCTSCGRCPWMGLNSLVGLRNCLRDGLNSITVDADIRDKALTPINRMLRFSASQGLPINAIGDA